MELLVICVGHTRPGRLNGIRHLMQLSDLDNLLSVGTICYQLGESYLNVFLLRKIDNLLSVYIFDQYWIVFLSDFMNLPQNRGFIFL